MTETYVITPNYNGKQFLKNYFETLLNQSYTNFKVIFIDNSTLEDSYKYIMQNHGEELKNGKIIFFKSTKNYGFAESNNLGIQMAFKDKECKYIIFLNNDTCLKQDFLKKLVSCVKRHPDASSIQPKMIWATNPNLIDSAGLEYSKNGLGFNRGAYKPVDMYNEEKEIFGCCAGACLFRREALEDVKIDEKYFDEDFFAYYEDFDLALRCRWAGWSSWYSPEAEVYHYKGASSGINSDFTIYHNWRNYTWTVFKNIPTFYLIKYGFLIFLCELIQLFINIKRRKIRAIFKAKIDAYNNLGLFMKKKKKIKKSVKFEKLERWFILKWKANTPDKLK
ncbi:MAG: glycosyltransferase family 2 protein [Methanobacteriaceae archaeon]|nr:glycosyltransferase family 2 protein [Methanobacteriaceae archaeon]